MIVASCSINEVMMPICRLNCSHGALLMRRSGRMFLAVSYARVAAMACSFAALPVAQSAMRA